MAAAPISTPTAAARWFRKLPVLLLQLASNCATCTSPSRASKIFFFTTREGVCANELENLSCHSLARCPRRSPQLRGSPVPDVSPAVDVRVHLRPRHGWQRLFAALLQEPVAAGYHGHLYDR